MLAWAKGTWRQWLRRRRRGEGTGPVGPTPWQGLQRLRYYCEMSRYTPLQQRITWNRRHNPQHSHQHRHCGGPGNLPGMKANQSTGYTVGFGDDITTNDREMKLAAMSGTFGLDGSRSEANTVKKTLRQRR
jgi:hypothetical protein